MVSNASIDTVKIETHPQNLPTKPSKIKEGDTVFARSFRNLGMERCADFFRDDWSANTARKMGFENFADWIDNKPDENGVTKDGVLSNLAREMVKHPVITIGAIVGTVFAGKAIYNAISKNKANTLANVTVNAGDATSTIASSTLKTPPKIQEITSVVEEVPLKSLDDQLSELRLEAGQGFIYEKSNRFKNLEIFDNLSEADRRRILSIAEYREKEWEFLFFASGDKPALLLGKSTNVFDGLANSKIAVVKGIGNADDTILLVNRSKAREIIKKNRLFFVDKFEMSKTTTVDEILDIICSGNLKKNKLYEAQNFQDLLELLNGSIEENAIFKQISQDLFTAEKYLQGYNVKKVYDESKNGLDALKNALKKFINSDKSVYKNLSMDSKQKVINAIDSMTEDELKRIYLRNNKLFLTDEYKQNEINILKSFVKKLKDVIERGEKLKFN